MRNFTKDKVGKLLTAYSKKKLSPELFKKVIKARVSFSGDERSGNFWIREIETLKTQLEYIEKKETEAYIPDNKLESLDEKQEQEKRYDKSNFIYDEDSNHYRCPEGKILTQHTKTRQKRRELSVYRGTDCCGCPEKAKCTKAKVRTIMRDGREPLQEKMREKLRSPSGKEIYQKRSYTVEPVFGNMKWNRAHLIMNLRGKRKVRGEFILMCLAHNIGKIIRKIQTKTEENQASSGVLMTAIA